MKSEDQKVTDFFNKRVNKEVEKRLFIEVQKKVKEQSQELIATVNELKKMLDAAQEALEGVTKLLERSKTIKLRNRTPFEEGKLKSLANGKLTVAEIAKQLGKSTNSVRQKLYEMKLSDKVKKVREVPKKK